MIWLAVACACGGGEGRSTSAAGPCDPQVTCPPPEAIVIRVTPLGAPAPVPGAFVTVRGQAGTEELGTVACSPERDASVCRVAVGPGRYDLAIGAPGFETAVARAEVTAADEACCPRVNVVSLDVPLAPR